ncbi:MAG: exodeoxyribonuclease V subunit gamma, partial [Gemmatimonadales bacterium]
MTFPPGLQLFICPDLRAAANDVLADVDALHPGPFDVPSVSVRHPSVRRYLTLELARRHGIAASVRFPAPQDLIDTLIGKPRRDPWDREALAWQIAAIIPEIAEQLPEGLAHALTEGDLLVRLDFARRLSTRLRDAMLHRPAMVEAWERGERYLAAVDDEVWYAELWRRLSKQLDAPSPIARFSNWRDGGAEVPKDPILLVGDATLPPLHREVLRLASQHTAVRWYIVDCNTPAFDPERPRRRPAALAALKALDNATITTVPAAHTSPPATSLLGRVQRALSGHFDAPVALAPDDRSVVAHRCHSAVREIESLREQLVRRLAEDASLQPHDAVLYVTDLETYLPAIDAVFGVPDDGLLRIPYEVAGRPWRSRAPIGAAVAALLHALAGRFGRSEILGLLEHPAIRQRAGFGFGDLGAIRNLVESVGIHWGVDGAHREARFDLPPEEGATWREGLSRLHQQRVPASDALEPDNTTTQIDRLTAWFERLASAEAIVATPHSIAEWRVIVDALISDFLTTWSSDDAEVLSGLRRSIEHLVTSSAAARIDATLPLAAIGQELEHILTETATSGDLRGGLRICALTPGMVLPARVVMIAGLDDALFPRGGGVPTWDILLQSRLDNDHDPL